jgi:hypothetical protein
MQNARACRGHFRLRRLYQRILFREFRIVAPALQHRLSTLAILHPDFDAYF